jgi:hypothetical protein
VEKVLEGSLARIEVPDLLTFLNMGRRTGCLVMERPTQETKLFFREGKPVFGTSTKEDLRFGSMLVRFGKVSPEALDRVLQKQSAGHRIGQTLLSEKILTEEQLASFLKIQVSEVIFDTFVWKEGTFTFFDRVPPPATAVTLEMDPQNLIMEGVRRIDERGRLNEVFSDLDMVVESVTNPERVKHSITLTQEEWQVFFLVDGRRTLSEICRLAGNPDELATLQILHHLLVAKFIIVDRVAETPVGTGAVVAAPFEPEGTQLGRSDAVAPPAPGSFSIEFNPPAPPRPMSDDTKEVVRPQAIPYMGNAKKLTVSRLVLFKDGAENSFPLTRDTYTLGRHRNNDIVINDAKVSAFHARIDRTPEGFTLVDLKSRNGSFINAKRIETGILQTGDEVRLGAAKLLYKVDYTSSVA